MYETTREVVAGLRMNGIDSRMIDIPSANKLFPQGYPQTLDRGAPIADMDWACEADVIVNHSGYDGTPLQKTDQPIVHVAHGRPRSTFLGEKNGGTPVYSYHYRQNGDPRWKAVVTFWPEHVKYLEVMLPDKPIHHVQAPVDLSAWTPSPTDYDFHGKGGAINVVCTDAWRDDIDPFLPLNAFALLARKHPGMKLHLYARQGKSPGFDAIIRRIQDDGNMGELMGWTKGLQEVYRAADVLLTGNTIDTRSVREAMACGCPVIRVDASLDTVSVDFPERESVRAEAEQRFDMAETAKQFKAVLEGI